MKNAFFYGLIQLRGCQSSCLAGFRCIFLSNKPQYITKGRTKFGGYADVLRSALNVHTDLLYGCSTMCHSAAHSTKNCTGCQWRFVDIMIANLRGVL